MFDSTDEMTKIDKYEEKAIAICKEVSEDCQTVLFGRTLPSSSLMDMFSAFSGPEPPRMNKCIMVHEENWATSNLSQDLTSLIGPKLKVHFIHAKERLWKIVEMIQDTLRLQKKAQTIHPIIVVTPQEQISKIRDYLRGALDKEYYDSVQCIRPQDRDLSQKLDDGDVLVTSIETFLTTDLKMPVSPLMICYELPADI